MALRMPSLNPLQLEAQSVVVAGLTEGNRLEQAGQRLGELENRKAWLAPPLLGVAAVEVSLIASRSPELWQVEGDLWERYLPDQRPSGKYQWRHANYALHAAGCLAGGLWLDVAGQESYWRMPLWPFALDLIELLAVVAQDRLSITPAEFAGEVAGLLADTPSLPVS